MDIVTSEKIKYLSELEAELKDKHFLQGDKLNPNILDGVDVIGFDVDHTISIYNISNIVKLLYESFSKFFIVNKNYPKEISYENNEDFIIKTCHNEIIFDFNKGNALKIDQSKTILKGYHGKNLLTKEEIIKMYPTGKFESYEPGVYYIPESYYFNKGNFEYHLVPLVLICVHYFDQGILKNITSYNQIRDDLFESLVFSFKLKDEFSDFSNSGYYFPEIAKNPEKYLYKYSARNLLEQIRKKGIKIFFATNSYMTYAEFILKNTVGEDFKQFFDLGIWLSKKPFFFDPDIEKNGTKCYFSDTTKIPIEILDEETYKRIKGGDYLIFEGSYKVVENYFKKELNKDKLNCVYVGDDLISDCCGPSNLERWKGIFISDSIRQGFIGKNPDNFMDNWKDVDEDKTHVDIKADLLSKNTLIALSNVEGIKYFI